MNDYSDTIFAVATAPGKAGVAVVRISGAHANDALAALGVVDLPAKRHANLYRLTRANEASSASPAPMIDHALVLRFEAPQSFTVEDVVELHTHGSRAVIQDILSYLATLPHFRMAEAGEFSRRAFANDKMDLTQVEGLADLIESETYQQKTQAIKQLEGNLQKLYEGWRLLLVETMAYLEAFIDFPDEDIPPDAYHNIQVSAEKLYNDLSSHMSDNRGERLRDGITISILGQPNVGKSSLLNYLAKRDVAIVSEHAGTTRDVLEVHLDIAGYPVMLVDTAGIRETEDAVEKEGVRRSYDRARKSDMKIVMVDASEPQSVDPVKDFLGDNALFVVNKSDVTQIISSDLSPYNPIYISILENSGVDVLINEIEKCVSIYMGDVTGSIHFTRERHRQCVEESMLHIERFISGLQKQLDLELLSEDVRQAARSMGRLTGHVDIEDLLDKIFSSFCIGK